MSEILVVAVVVVRVDLLGSALDGGRVDLDRSILEGGRALEIVRALLCGGAKDISFLFSV